MFKKRTQQKPIRRTRSPLEKPPTSKVFSYYNVKRPVEVQEDKNPSARQVRGDDVAKKHRNITFRRIGAFGVIVLVAGLLLYNIRLNSSGVTVVIKGTPEQRLLLQEPSVYRDAAQKSMARKFSNQNKLTFNVKAINSELTKQFPEIANANVSLPLFGSNSIVYIEPSSAALILTAKDNKTYVINSNGRVISTNTSSAASNLPTVSDQSAISPSVGTQVLPSGDVRAIYTIIHQLKEKNIEIESMALPTAAQRLEVKVQGRPYTIRFTLHENILQQVGAYIAVRQKLERENVVPSQYVDVRVADRVYYK